MQHGGNLLKELRTMKSDFRIALLPAQAVTPIAGQAQGEQNTTVPQPATPA
jgi:hypothetical protein